MNSIYKTVLKLGIPARFLGFDYLAYGTELCTNDLTKLRHVTKRLYPEIAEHFDVKQSNVERDLRTAALYCWDHGDKELLESIAERKLFDKPDTAGFFSILTFYFKEHGY